MTPITYIILSYRELNVQNSYHSNRFEQEPLSGLFQSPLGLTVFAAEAKILSVFLKPPKRQL
jgi:hypothetical protein